LLLGCEQLVTRLRRHPLARALRVDKLTLAALEASLRGPATPTAQALAADPGVLHQRARAIATALAAQGVDAVAVASQATVGGGGAPGVTLDSAALSLPERYAPLLRAGNPPVLGRVERGRCLLDLRALPAHHDATVRDAVLACTP
jgi:L-seryl-tRNA(Ser) seleniumtransferase